MFDGDGSVVGFVFGGWGFDEDRLGRGGLGWRGGSLSSLGAVERIGRVGTAAVVTLWLGNGFAGVGFMFAPTGGTNEGTGRAFGGGVSKFCTQGTILGHRIGNAGRFTGVMAIKHCYSPGKQEIESGFGGSYDADEGGRFASGSRHYAGNSGDVGEGYCFEDF